MRVNWLLPCRDLRGAASCPATYMQLFSERHHYDNQGLSLKSQQAPKPYKEIDSRTSSGASKACGGRRKRSGQGAAPCPVAERVTFRTQRPLFAPRLLASLTRKAQKERSHASSCTERACFTSCRLPTSNSRERVTRYQAPEDQRALGGSRNRLDYGNMASDMVYTSPHVLQSNASPAEELKHHVVRAADDVIEAKSPFTLLRAVPRLPSSTKRA
jgi:hypothetical protein